MKMNCPKCNKKIDKLANIVSGSMEYTLTVSSSGVEHYEQTDFYNDSNINEFLCPVCNQTLFYGEEEAVEFLKSGV